MIYSFVIDNPKTLPIPWWSNVKSLKPIKKLEFTPGLNVLWGRNGSGKSTVLKLMARFFHAEQGGVSTVTRHSIDGMIRGFSDVTYLTGAKFDHDGKPVFFVDPGCATGISGGSFDEDFFGQGIHNTMLKASDGQTTTHRTMMVLAQIKNTKEIKFTMDRDRVNEVWQDRLDKISTLLKSTGEPGPVTILLDEPDRSLDFDAAEDVWSFLPKVAKTCQVIVATHHWMALHVAEANYIELSKGYLGKCRKVMKS